MKRITLMAVCLSLFLCTAHSIDRRQSSSSWSLYSAVNNLNMSGNSITNALNITATGNITSPLITWGTPTTGAGTLNVNGGITTALGQINTKNLIVSGTSYHGAAITIKTPSNGDDIIIGKIGTGQLMDLAVFNNTSSFGFPGGTEGWANYNGALGAYDFQVSSAGVYHVTALKAPTVYAGGANKTLNFKGISCTAVLMVTTPGLYDVYFNTDTFAWNVASGTVVNGFKAGPSFGATP